MREYTVEVTGLSPSATEQDVGDFFAFCGEILRIEIERYYQFTYFELSSLDVIFNILLVSFFFLSFSSIFLIIIV